MPERRPLGLPVAPLARFRTNFLQLAVVEFRFPTLLELEDGVPPTFHARVRPTFPLSEPQQNVTVNPAGTTYEPRYLFHTRDRRWTVALSPSSLLLETKSYTNFNEFRERVLPLARAAKDTLDLGFFTRIGLRYVNAIKIPRGDALEEWVARPLLGALALPELGDPIACMQEIRGTTASGFYSIRHGLSPNGAEGPQNDANRSYYLDIDSYVEDLDLEQGIAEPLLKGLKERAFDIFAWAIGPKTRNAME